jgi:hypothetical protein
MMDSVNFPARTPAEARRMDEDQARMLQLTKDLKEMGIACDKEKAEVTLLKQENDRLKQTVAKLQADKKKLTKRNKDIE